MGEYRIDLPGAAALAGAGDGSFLRVEGGMNFSLAFPRFSFKELAEAPDFVFSGLLRERGLRNGGQERALLYTSDRGLSLEADIQTFPASPALRFRMRLVSDRVFHFDKAVGGHAGGLLYTAFSLEKAAVTEFQFAQFIPHIHSYVPVLNQLRDGDLRFGVSLPGPSLIFEDSGGGEAALVFGYEHGAVYPDSFLEYRIAHNERGKTGVELRARKGNFYDGQPVGGKDVFTSVWFHLLMAGAGSLPGHYRTFFERCITQNTESRKPYVFYNTWNYQERDHNLRGMSYLANMGLERILAEIETAHKMGIEVFVIDTGWFEKTGEWQVNLKRFPDGLKKVSQKLSSYNMKLGLWFNPTAAAGSSQVIAEHPEFRMSLNGEIPCGPVWETEDSYGVCLASPYWEHFAEKIIAISRELGVTYFKWDGIGQSGCDSPLHDHGGEANSPEERAECYGYLLGCRMIQTVEKITEACPEAIVDFDITETGRFAGLGFLAAGKYFLVNNGPYAKDFDIPRDYRFGQEKPVTIDGWTNIFFYPGAARPRFCRTGVRYDTFIPSTLFLTHYLPDGDSRARENSFAGFVLGGSGIWGPLAGLTDEEILFWRNNLALYKQVREAAASAAAKVTGCAGSSPEIYEKVDASGRGLVSFFTGEPGTYSCIAGPFSQTPQVLNASSYEFLEEGFLKLTVNLERDGARTVFLI
jgi:alpha-galactosidase